MAGKKVQWPKKLETKGGTWTEERRHLRSPYPSSKDLLAVKDPAPLELWAVKSVLSIDGGGISGYSSLVIVEALMEEIGKIEIALDPKATSSLCSPALGPLDAKLCAAPTRNGIQMSEYRPCHYFDYIGGVGTGGIVAMLLGRYRMSVREAKDRYRDICATAIEQSRGHKLSIWQKFHAKDLVPAWPSHDESSEHLQSDPERCRTIVCGCGSNLQPLRSYDSPSRTDLVKDVILQCVGPATQCYNNPSRTMLTEVSLQLPKNMFGKKDIDLLSVGGAIYEPVHLKTGSLQDRTSKQTNRVHPR